MRNYSRNYFGTTTYKDDINNINNDFSKKKPRTKVVIEDNTIYEIDLDCYECAHKDCNKG